MGTHVADLTVGTLDAAARAARAVDHPVTLVDDLARVIVVVDQAGHVVVRPEERTR